MNLTINRYNSHAQYSPFQPSCAPENNFFSAPSPLGQQRPGIGSFIGGLVGSILGQVLCPVPFLGAMIGGVIGSMFGSMLDSLLQMGAPCCCHNMGQNYGPMNQSMAGCYGYPGQYPYLPPNFHNPPYNQAPPLFPTHEPPVAPGRFPELGFLPWGNNQHQHNDDHTTKRPQVAVAVAGKNTQVQENTSGHNHGAQLASNGVGVNEQVQKNVHGDNAGTQVATVVVGANHQAQENVTGDNEGTQVAVAVVGKNTQTQENQSGDNEGTQVAVAVVGANEQEQSNVTGDNKGKQVAVAVVGSNDQAQTNVTGDNAGTQVAVTEVGNNEQVQTNVVGDNLGAQVADTTLGSNEQVQANQQGDNNGAQVADTVIGSNDQAQTNVHGDNTGLQDADSLIGGAAQRQESVTGDNEGNQNSDAFIGSSEQRQETVTGDNVGDQNADTVFGSNVQVKTTETGDATGNQTAETFVGDNTQVNIAGGSVVTDQEAGTTHGDNTQVIGGGDATVAGQEAQSGSGDNAQAIQTGDGSIAVQEAQTNSGDNDQSIVVGDSSVASQVAESGTGSNKQHIDGGENVIATQVAEGDDSAQSIVIESGSATQVGGTEQFAAGTSGPVSIDQQGPRYGDAQQDGRGSDQGDSIAQAAGQGFLNLFDNKTTANAELGAGNDLYTYDGNSEANHVRLDGGGQHVGPDQDVARIDTKGGNDTVIVNLSGDRDTYQVDLGSGNDRLVVNEDGQRVRIVGTDGREIYRSEGWTEQDSTASVNGMENLTVYREDGTFARWDSRNGLQEGRDPGQPGEMSPVAAARLLREYAGDLDKAAGTGNVDGIIGRGDLTAALNNPETPQELRDAIQYTLGNEAMWRALDASGAGSNRVDLQGLNQFIDGYETRPSYDAGAPMTDRQAVSVLNYHNTLLDTAASGGGTDSKFNEDDLRAIAGGNNANLPPELRAAAQRLLGSSSLQENVDSVSWETGGMFDSQRTFSNADLAGYR